MAVTEEAKVQKVVCRLCKAGIDEPCKSRNGSPAPTHLVRYKEAGVPVPSDRTRVTATTTGAKPAVKKAAKRPARKVSRPKKKVVGVNSATVGEFMNDLEKLREKWALNGGTVISVTDDETAGILTATYDDGAWRVSLGGK